MKKNLSFIMVLLTIITGCKNNEKINDVENQDKPVQIEEQKDEYVDNNPIVVGLYDNDYNLVKEYNTTKQNFKDLIFSVYYTNQEVLDSNNQKYNWNKFYNEYTNIDNYKIGFSFSFSSGEEKIEKTILEPETYAFNPYFYIYLYDDIIQPDGSFYSHLEKTDVNENTIFSSIKIYLVEADKITSPIELTVFTYDGEEDFDEFNKYKGKSRYTIKINLI